LKKKFELLWKNAENPLHLEVPEKEARDTRSSRTREITLSIWGLLAWESFHADSGRQLKDLSLSKNKEPRLVDQDMILGLQEQRQELLALHGDDLLLSYSEEY
jgi:hypothetical protein